MNHLRSAVNLFILLGFILLGSCSGNSDKLPADIVSNPNSASGNLNIPMPVIEFEKDIHDFGKVIQGEKVSYGFKFKNTGNADLLIAQVSTTCGCTVPKYPKKAIKPGEEEIINVMFDSEGKKGIQNKSITVVTNCQPSNMVIRIKAMVVVL